MAQELGENHKLNPGVWVDFHKAHTGVNYSSARALCAVRSVMGGSESLIKGIDEDRIAFKVTLRKPMSKWFDVNRRRWTELKMVRLLMSAGLAAAPTENKYSLKSGIPELLSNIAKNSNSILMHGGFYDRRRSGNGSYSSSGANSRSDLKRAIGASASR